MYFLFTHIVGKTYLADSSYTKGIQKPTNAFGYQVGMINGKSPTQMGRWDSVESRTDTPQRYEPDSYFGIHRLEVKIFQE